LRILHSVLSGGFYGSERYCIDLAMAQARTGHDVVVLAHDRQSTCAQQFLRLKAEAEAATPFAGALRIAILPRALPAWLHRVAAWRLLRRHKPDITHTHLNPAARRVGRVAERLGIPHVATLLIHYNEREHASCDGLVAVTRAQRDTLPEKVRAKTAAVWLALPAGADAAIARVAPAAIDALRRQWGAGERDVVFTSVGRLTPVKGMDVLVRAFRDAFPDRAAGVRLVLVGDGDDRAMLEKLADGDARIVFAGHHADMAPVYRACDVFVSAARFEPFGLAIVEAMAAGCRLIVTRTDGPSEFLADPRVLWADPDRSDQLATQLAAAAPAGRERWSYDMSRLTVDRFAAEIEAFYREILARKARGQTHGVIARESGQSSNHER
jgi:glycosyltransferase involved in cell wall biosynthesis